MHEGGDRWSSGDAYEAYVGRWSRLVAREVVGRLAVAPGRRWLDVGCGTGALTATILAAADPASVVGIDPSEAFLEHARATIVDPRATFLVASADATGQPEASVDIAISGLVLNFVPDTAAALAEMHRVVVPGGVVSAHVWDYAEGMAFMRHFWDAAIEVDDAAADADEATRFPIARRGPLADAFTAAGFADVVVEEVVVDTTFADFEDLWRPFLGGTGAAPAYLARRPPAVRSAVEQRLRERLAFAADGSIPLKARAWWGRGRRP